MKITLSLPLLFAFQDSARALYQDEAGQNDFIIHTSGHGIFGATYAAISSDHQSVITSSSSLYAAPFAKSKVVDNPSTGCYVTSRKLDSGEFNWRRNACSSATMKDTFLSPSVHHAVYSPENKDILITLDRFGMVRFWDDINGNMNKEFHLSAELRDELNVGQGTPRIIHMDGGNFYGAILMAEKEDVKTEVVVIFDENGYKSYIDARDLLKAAKIKLSKATPTIFGASHGSKGTFNVLVGGDTEGITTKADMALVDFSISEKGVVEIGKNSKIVDSSSKETIYSSSLHLDTSGVVRAKTVEEDASEESFKCNSIIYSPSTLGIHTNHVSILSVKQLQCTDFFTTVLVSTSDGLTRVYNVKKGKESKVDLKWEQEEGLSHATSAFFLDKGVSLSAYDSDEEDLFHNLSFASRVSAQVEGIRSFFMGGFLQRLQALVHRTNPGDLDEKISKEASFGLNKVAVILSSNFNKVLGMETSKKGAVMWTVNLNEAASWHKIVHGTSTSRSSALGQGKHHPHSPETLVLSNLQEEMKWMCVDGMSGEIISEGSVSLSSSVVQVVPLHGNSNANGGCKQNAVLILEDGTFVNVPKKSSGVLNDNVYSHVIDVDNGIFKSIKVHASEENVEVVGETLFNPTMEKVVSVTYPQRNEVVQSPVTILGDDSLLLKYLNPHICVIVTEATEEYINQMENGSNDLVNSLESSQNLNGTTKKKPTGVTKTEDDASTTKKVATIPTLFVNVIDTVSGQVLHRASHSHASLGAMSTVNVPVVISENWIIYAFTNVKSRRSEIGVLTLHEGMIDKNGISAFSTPEQQLSFSSFTSQKPIVLSKTFAVNYPIQAMGVTNTKSGISTKFIIASTGVDGKVVKIDRRLLDPRRPFSEPNKSEKMEGLLQYSPLLPLSPMFVESYSENVESPSIITSTSANLESQTLILALGGPDIFFTRFAPSKGFDSLPESFNKLSIVIVLIALYMVIQTLKSMSEKKFVKQFWS